MKQGRTKQFVMTCGNIGTGKTTSVNRVLMDMPVGSFLLWNTDVIAQALNNGAYTPEVHTTEYMSVYLNLKYSAVNLACQLGLDIVLDDCHMHTSERAVPCQLAKMHGYECNLLVHLHASGVDRRMTSDPRGYPAELWEEIHTSFAAKWVEPSKEEGWDNIYFMGK